MGTDEYKINVNFFFCLTSLDLSHDYWIKLNELIY